MEVKGSPVHRVDDGRTGPWLRKPHARDGKGVLMYDARCQRCLALAEYTGNFYANIENETTATLERRAARG